MEGLDHLAVKTTKTSWGSESTNRLSLLRLSLTVFVHCYCPRQFNVFMILMTWFIMFFCRCLLRARFWENYHQKSYSTLPPSFKTMVVDIIPVWLSNACSFFFFCPYSAHQNDRDTRFMLSAHLKRDRKKKRHAIWLWKMKRSRVAHLGYPVWPLITAAIMNT